MAGVAAQAIAEASGLMHSAWTTTLHVLIAVDEL